MALIKKCYSLHPAVYIFVNYFSGGMLPLRELLFAMLDEYTVSGLLYSKFR